MKYILIFLLIVAIIYKKSKSDLTYEEHKEKQKERVLKAKKSIVGELIRVKLYENKITLKKIVKETEINIRELLDVLDGSYEISENSKQERYLVISELIFLEIGLNTEILKEIWNTKEKSQTPPRKESLAPEKKL